MDSVYRFFSSVLSNILPRYIGVESTNRCNLKCPVCATSQYMHRDKGEMTIELFQTLIDQIDWKVKMINLGYSGEPLLNKNLFALIRLAGKKGIKVGFETNGFFVEDFAEEIVASGTDYINIAIDGASQESLVKYRVGSDFERIVRGIKRLTQLKKSKESNRPLVALQFLIMRHNQDEIDFVRSLAKECGVDELKIKTFNVDLGFWLTEEKRKGLLQQFEPTNKAYSRYNTNRKGEIFSKTRPYCKYVFTSPVILYNGDVSLCCLDFNGEYLLGNIKTDSLKSIWKGERYNQLRSKACRRALEICRKCSFDYSVNTKLDL